MLTVFVLVTTVLQAQTVQGTGNASYQIPDSSFEDWSDSFNGQPALGATWNGANIHKVALGINVYGQVVHRTDERRSGSYAAKLVDTEVGAAGITEISPSWISIGQPWAYIDGLKTNTATAGTDGGMQFTARPDTMAVWIKRVSEGTEHINLVYYSWKGTSRGDKYKAKDGSCSSTTHYDEESDIRRETDPNTCGTAQTATQIGEGWFQTSQQYGNWTQIKVPISYYNDEKPEKMNVILSASNYPEGRRNDGLYNGNYMIVDDISLIYSSKIHEIRLGGRPLEGFNPNNYTYTIELGEFATVNDIPTITCKRSGRTLSGSEIMVDKANDLGQPTTITVTAEDGSSTSTYTLMFVRKRSTNPRLDNIFVDGVPVPSFSGYVTDYVVDVAYGTTQDPVITVQKGEADQTVQIESCHQFPCVAKVISTAANPDYSVTYNLTLKEGQLTDNTLQDILINGNPIPGFKPTTNTYLVELPLGTTQAPTIEAVSKYADGDQKIEITNNGLDGRSTIVVTPPAGTARTYRISYVITESSYSFLKDLQVAGQTVAGFDPETTQYQVTLPVGTTTVPQITWTQGDPYQAVTLTNEGVDGTSRITVVAQNGNKTIYRIAFTVEKSTVHTLNNILVDGVALPGFSPDVFDYTYNVNPAATTRPVVTWHAADAYQVVTKNPASESGVTIEGVTKLTVRAQNGDASVYSITFTQQLSDNAKLANLQVAGHDLTPAFNPEVTQYDCRLKRGTTVVPTISFEKGDPTQVVRVEDHGVNGVATVIVKAQTGVTMEYKISFSVEVSSDATLKDIVIGGTSLEGFEPNTLLYDIVLPPGTTTLPTIEAVKNDVAQRVAMIKGGVNGTTQIKVVAEDGTDLTYELTFTVEKSENANLQAIYVGDQPLADFNPETYAYRYVLAPELGQCPIVKAEGYPGQTITTTMPKLTGIARIEVLPEQGNMNVYTIEFVREMSDNNKLKNMWVNGEAFGYDPDINDYTIALPMGTTQVPTITYTVGDKLQTVQIISGGLYGTTQVVVIAADGNKNVYNLHFSVEKLDQTQLLAINVNGTILEGFDPEVLTYTYMLPVGTTQLPAVTYVAADGQHVSMSLPMLEGDALITATSPQGSSQTYTVTFKVESLTDATLQGIFANGQLLPNFDKDEFTYQLSYIQGEPLPAITYQKQDATQQVVVNDQGVNGCTLTVTAQNGNTQTYQINYQQVVNTNSSLQDILVYNKQAGQFESVPGFDSNTYQYTISPLAWRSTVLPAIQPVPGAENQSITMQEGGVNGATVIKVVAQDGETTSTYTLHFSVTESNDATLSSIILDDNELPGFDPATDNYTIELPYGTTQAPNVLFQHALYDNKYPITEQQVEVSEGGMYGTTTLKVTAQDGVTTKTYSINFTKAYSGLPNVLRQIEFVNANEAPVVMQEGVFNYTKEFRYGTTTLPELKVVKNYPEQEVKVAKVGNNYQLTVIANQPAVADVTYTLACSVAQSSVSMGVTWKGDVEMYPAFNSNVYQYVVKGNPGDIIPITDPLEVYTESKIEGNKRTITVTDNYDETNSKTYTFYCNPNKLETTIQSSVIDLYKFATAASGGQLEQSYTLLAPINSISFKAKEQLWSTGGIGVQEKVGNNWTEIYYKELGTSYGDCAIASDKINSNASEIKFLPMGSLHFYYKDVVVKYITLGINSITVNGKKANKNGKTFTVEIDPEFVGEPQLKIESDIHAGVYGSYWKEKLSNEAYGITWKENANGNKEATIVYYDMYGRSNTYTLVVTRPKSSNAQLSALVVGGQQITDLKPAPAENVITIPAHAQQLPDFYAVAQSQFATVSFTSVRNRSAVADEAAATNVKQSINVLSEDGTSSNVYYIVFAKEYNTDASLQDIMVGDASIMDQIDAQTLSCTINLPAGTTELPAVTYTKQYESQQVALLQGSTTTLNVTAEDGTTTQTYTINFVVEETPTSAQLSSLEILNEGIALQPAFSKDVYEYTFNGTDATQLMFNYQREFDADVVSIASTPAYAYITVANQQTTHVYTVAVQQQPLSDNALLKDLLINGTSAPGFNPAQEEPYSFMEEDGMVYDVQPVLAQEGQTMRIAYNPETATYTIDVTAANGQNTRAYQVVFNKPISADASLAAIKVGDKLLTNFTPEELIYPYTINYRNSDAPTAKWEEPTLPHIAAISGAKGQSIAITNNGINGTTYILVTAQSGATNQYEINFAAQPSNYVYLNNIFINCEKATEFYYKNNNYTFDVPVTQERPTITYEAGDAFQTITEEDVENKHLIKVTAQNGDEFTYTITFNTTYTRNALLAGITLDGVLIPQFASDDDEYDVELPVGTTVLPTIGVINGADGQTTQVVTNGVNGDAIIIVTADDNETKATYKIHFTVDKSQVNTLLDIQLDGVSVMEEIDPITHTYTHYLPVGTRTWPLVSWTQGDAYQTVEKTETEVDDWNQVVVLEAIPEDPEIASTTYTITMEVEKSAVDTLKAIQFDNVLFERYHADSTYYKVELPVGTKNYPEVTYTMGDEFQVVTPDVSETGQKVTLHVVAENGQERTYTIEFVILHSSNANLAAIYLDYELMKDFKPEQTDYPVVLPYGTTKLPVITFDKAEVWQNATIDDKLDHQALSGSYTINVNAEDGVAHKSYTLHFSVALSDNAWLSNLLVNGESIPNFDAEVLAYTYPLPYGQKQVLEITGVPAVEDQIIEVVNATSINEVSTITVTAPDGYNTNTYKVTWVNEKSTNAQLNMIYLDGKELEEFEPGDSDYSVMLPYGTTQLPEVSWTQGDADQTVQAERTDKTVVISVTAQDGTPNEYILTFTVEKSDENRLQNIFVKGQPIKDFDPDHVEYTLTYGVGTQVSDLATATDVTYEVFNDAEQVNIVSDGSLLMLQVKAENGDMRTYVIVQEIALSGNTQLDGIFINGELIPGFEPDRLDYIYILPYGSVAVPTDITYLATDTTMQVSMAINQLNEPTQIFVTAQDGTEVVYTIQFEVNSFNPATVPTQDNVCVSMLPNGLWKFTTDCNNVSLYLSTLDGKVICISKLPLVDANIPNICDVEANGYVYETNMDNIVAYYFMYNTKEVIKSGKLRISHQ